jgi:hypothetical protein
VNKEIRRIILGRNQSGINPGGDGVHHLWLLVPTAAFEPALRSWTDRQLDA